MAEPTLFPGNRDINVGANETVTIGGGRTESVGKSVVTGIAEHQQVTVGKKLLLTAGDEIELRVGAAKLVMRKDGTILLTGRDITIEGFGSARIKSSGDIVLKGSKVLQN